MRSKQDNHDPAGDARAKALPESPEPDKSKDEAEASNQDSSVISVTTFKSPKGNVYRITRTNEVDDYERSPKPPRE